VARAAQIAIEEAWSKLDTDEARQVDDPAPLAHVLGYAMIGGSDGQARQRRVY